MSSTDILEGKYVLIVDDEPDVLESLIEILDVCKIDTAGSFNAGKKMLENNDYDIAILDIMGVDGLELIPIAKERQIPALMLTANSLNEKSIKHAAEKGAAYFAPKEKMSDIDLFAADVLLAVERKKSPWIKLFDRLSGFYDRKFHGSQWREQEKHFWEKKLRDKF